MTEAKIADACGRIRSRDDAVSVVTAAIEAERERCAVVAEKFAEANARFNEGDEAQVCVALGLAIAAQIRDPKSPPF